MRHKSRPCPFR